MCKALGNASVNFQLSVIATGGMCKLISLHSISLYVGRRNTVQMQHFLLPLPNGNLHLQMKASIPVLTQMAPHVIYADSGVAYSMQTQQNYLLHKKHDT